MIIHLLTITKFSFNMKGYTICWLHHIVHYIISLKYPYLNTWRSKWVLQPTTKPKVDIKLCFLRRFKTMSWSLAISCFHSFVSSSLWNFCLSHPLCLTLWKNRITTARRKPVNPFSELLIALLLLWTWNQAIHIFLLCALDNKKWWTQSLQTMPITTAWRSNDKVMVWTILQRKSPFCQEESIYFFHLILSLSISY